MATDSRVCAGGVHTLSYSCQLEKLFECAGVSCVYLLLYNGHIKYVLRELYHSGVIIYSLRLNAHVTLWLHVHIQHMCQ